MVAPAAAWRLSLFMLLLPLTIAQEPPVKGHSQVACFYNSRANISCAWSPGAGVPTQACHLHARSNKRSWNVTCQLFPVTSASSACNLILGDREEAQKLTAADRVNISLLCWEGQRWRMVATQDFRPFDNLRLKTPDALQASHVDSHTCNITWSVSQVSHYIQSDLEFEVRKRSPAHSWEEASVLSLKQSQRWIFLEKLSPDTGYELQVRVRPQLGSHTAWSSWSQALAFRTKPEDVALVPWTSVTLAIGCLLGLFIFTYFLANCWHFAPWLKTALGSHTPDPSRFFSQKWLSSPFPASSFSPAGLAPEISPLEVLDRSAKATQLLLLQQDKVSSPSPSGHSHTSCFTNQGYFFFQLPDALEMEACQVYFTYDPCVEEEPEEPPSGPPLLPLPPPGLGDEHAYCTFPPGDDLLLFSPTAHGGPGGRGTSQGRLSSTQQDGSPQALGFPMPVAPELQAPSEDGEEVPASGFPWTSPPGQHQGKAPAAGLALNTDVYLSLQELQAQDPTQLM